MLCVDGRSCELILQLFNKDARMRQSTVTKLSSRVSVSGNGKNHSLLLTVVREPHSMMHAV